MDILGSIQIWEVVKVFALLGLAIYLIFAFVVVRQVQLMTDTLEVGFEIPVRYLSYLHLIFSILVFVMAIITL